MPYVVEGVSVFSHIHTPDEDEHFDIMHSETKPHYLNYLNAYNKNKTNPDLLTSDFAFCRMFAEL